MNESSSQTKIKKKSSRVDATTGLILPSTSNTKSSTTRQKTKKHSFMGVLSCCLAGFAAMIAMVGVPVKTSSGVGMAVLLVILVSAVVGMCTVGIGLGLVGLMSKRRRKVLSACGLIANPVVLGLLAMYLWWPTPHTLVLAATIGDVSAVQDALKFGVDVNAKTTIPRRGEKRTTTALITAADRGWLDVVAALIASGADLKAVDGEGKTALYRSAASGHLDVVKLLLSQGAHPDGSGSPPTPLCEAARAGYLSVVQLLAERGASINTTKGIPPLGYAAAGGHTRTVDYLIVRGATVTATDDEGNTPLHLAAANGHYYSVNKLLRFKADPNTTNNHGETPLEIAVQNGRRDIVRLLIEAGTSIDAFTTIGLGDIEALKLLLTQDPEAVNTVKRGRTPLHVACELGLTDAVTALLEAGAAANPARDNITIRTPLNEAIKHKNAEVIKTLLENGADPNASYEENNTIAAPLYYAVISGQLDAVKLLIKHGAEINAHCITPGIDGPPLYFSVHYGKDEIARVLIENNADVNARKNKDSPTVLYEAIMRENLEIVKLLLKRKADPNAKVLNMSPLTLARKRLPNSPFIYNQIVFLLEHYGAKA